MPITHIVLFQFKDSLSKPDVQTALEMMNTLPSRCLHPETKAPYIMSITGGEDISIENLQDGITHAFVARFASVADRDYYVQKDPAHAAFVGYVADKVAKVQVLDFEEGVFQRDIKGSI